MYNLFTRLEAQRIGLTSHTLEGCLRCCAMRVRPGLYTVGRPCAAHAALLPLVDDPDWGALVAERLGEGDKSPEFERGLHLAHAAGTSLEGHLLSHRTAALALGLPILGRPPKRLELTHPSHGRGTALHHVRERAVPPHEVVILPGFVMACTSAARTVMDLGRDLGVEAGLLAADAHLDRRKASPGTLRSELRQRAAELGPCRNARRITTVLEWATGLSESPAESRAMYALRVLGVGPLQQQVEVALPGGGRARIDIMVGRTAIEVDGWSKYDSRTHGSALLDLKREKRREDGLRALGLHVIRLEWRDFDRPGALAAKLGRLPKSPRLPDLTPDPPGEVGTPG